MDRNSIQNAQLRKLLSLFPYDHARPAQIAALKVIARMFSEGSRFTVIEAPTGSAKSALALSTALFATTLQDGEFDPGAYILTPYNNLAAQMTGSFSNLGLAAMKGRKHYGLKSTGSYEDARADFVKARVTDVTRANLLYLTVRNPARHVLNLTPCLRLHVMINLRRLSKAAQVHVESDRRHSAQSTSREKRIPEGIQCCEAGIWTVVPVLRKRRKLIKI